MNKMMTVGTALAMALIVGGAPVSGAVHREWAGNCYADADRNGVCDNCGLAEHDGWCGNCYVDADGNDVCDNCGLAEHDGWCGNCYVDADG
ncbi:MAG: hypothetical protein OSJ69_14345, partial [Acetatifactor sp.]|nr:hypothetical protein [Acetatifactor sp.]